MTTRVTKNISVYRSGLLYNQVCIVKTDELECFVAEGEHERINVAANADAPLPRQIAIALFKLKLSSWPEV